MTDTAATRRPGTLTMTVASLAWSTAGFFARNVTTDLAATVFWRSLFAFLGMIAVLLMFQGRDGRQRHRPGHDLHLCRPMNAALPP